MFASGLAGCGSMGPGPLASSSSTSPRSDGGLSSDSGVRWLGAEPLGALVAETAPRGALPPPPPPPPEPASEGPARRPFGIGASGVAPAASATAPEAGSTSLLGSQPVPGAPAAISSAPPSSAPPSRAPSSSAPASSTLRPPPPPSRLRTPPPAPWHWRPGPRRWPRCR
ncbi:MAG: hypothetical protein ACKOSS_00595, partial [Planctomycetia bacterium]